LKQNREEENVRSAPVNQYKMPAQIQNPIAGSLRWDFVRVDGETMAGHVMQIIGFLL
jgi:hypothetical protein